jgi:hypothetical protein
MTWETISNGFIFGNIDNLVVIVGVIWGVTNLESHIARWCGNLSKKWSVLLGATLGGGNANSLSDLLGCLFDPTMIDSTIGITLGTQVPLIPFYILLAILVLRK